MKLYPEQALWDEIAYLAYHLHWDLDTLLDLAARRPGPADPLGRRAERPGVGGDARCPMTASTASGSPRPRSSFEVDGVEIGRFMEVSGLEVNVGVEEIEEGGENSFVHKLPGPDDVAEHHAEARHHAERRACSTWLNKSSGEQFAATGNKLDPLDGGDHAHRSERHSGCGRGSSTAPSR